MRRLLLAALLIAPLAVGAQATDVRIKKRATVVVATAVSVTTSATALPSSVAASRISICLTNNSTTTTVYIGPSGVTTSSGTPLSPGASYCDDTAAPLYGIVSSGTADVRVLEN